MVYLRFTYEYFGILIPHIACGIHITPYDGMIAILSVYIKNRGMIIEYYNFNYKMTIIDEDIFI